MEDVSDREKKLVNYVVFLIQILNGYTMLVAALYKNLNWLEKNFVDIEMNKTESEMIEYLNTEYNAQLKVVLDKDALK
jgi:hypothetical protein